jgi:hypothetical protein
MRKMNWIDLAQDRDRWQALVNGMWGYELDRSGSG